MASKKNVLDLTSIVERDTLAANISDTFTKWKSARLQWEKEKREIRNFVFGTDTSSTTGKTLPWKNTTTLPKLCQIRDNLHANYMAALFPTQGWFKWIAGDQNAANKEKARIIEAYMKTKLESSRFRDEVSKLVYDFIDYGNAFGEVVYINEQHTDPDDNLFPIYKGPKLSRISPFDIVFDLTANSFENTPKITRALYSMGELRKLQKYQQDVNWIDEAFNSSYKVRKQIKEQGYTDIAKSEALQVDGFGDAYQYFSSGMVEVLEFEGDLYDEHEDELLENHRITILDRMFVARKEPFKSWLGRSNKQHTGWRLRPDNLIAMGPLDNLIGMQYRIDHLENLKADVFDQIATPVVYQKGYVEDWEWGPNARIYGDNESDVRVLSPDTTALNADFQIQNMLNTMEEMAGAPKQAMGIRTPGEKTAFEVQSLEAAAGRIFQSKVNHFEQTFLEPLLNQMLAAARQNIDVSESIQVVDEDLGAVEFLTITQSDIEAKGKLMPMGARHFAKQNQIVQNLLGLLQSPAYQDPSVNTHISGKRIAALFQEVLNLEEYELVKDNVRVEEGLETQRLSQVAQEQAAQEAQISPDLEGLTDEDRAMLEEQAGGEV